jgi:hypothetical protein
MNWIKAELLPAGELQQDQDGRLMIFFQSCIMQIWVMHKS